MSKIVIDRPVELTTRVEIDPDLHAVAEWMQANIPAARLVAIAGYLNALAPVLWGRYQTEDSNIDPLRLAGILISEPRTPVASNV